MDTNRVKQLFPSFEEGLYEEIIDHGIIREVKAGVITSYRTKFEELLKTIDAIAFNGVDERLEFYLKNQMKKMGRNLKITHQEIANDLSSSREVISRLLKKMEAKNWLIIHRNSIEWIKKD